jgi:hypothetical protein
MNIVTVTGETGTNTWTYTAPSGRNMRISWIHCVYTSDGNAGNRQIVLQVLDPSNTVITDFAAGAVQAASNAYHYAFMTGIYRETSFIDGELQVAIPNSLVIPPSYKLKIYDSAGVSGSDSMAINFQYKDLV